MPELKKLNTEEARIYELVYGKNITLNHNMVKILFYMFSCEDKWVTSAEITNDLCMTYSVYKKARDKLVYLRLINEKRGVKFLATAKLFSLNFKDLSKMK